MCIKHIANFKPPKKSIKNQKKTVGSEGVPHQQPEKEVGGEGAPQWSKIPSSNAKQELQPHTGNTITSAFKV
jgi:hypothetical protein